MIENLLDYDPENRMTAKEALDHAYFSGRKDVVVSSMRDLAAPTYWHTAGLIDCRVSRGTNNWSLVEVTSDTSLKQQLQNVMAATCKTSLGFIVEKIWHVENPRLWYYYANQRKDTLEQRCRIGTPSIESVSPATSKFTWGQGMIDASINEVMLFHGVKEASVATQMLPSRGFNERKGGSDSLFGIGIYFTECSSKSNNDCAQGSGPLYMFLSRVTLGKAYKATDHMKNARCAPDGYDSVIAEHNDHKEFIVYDGRQAYPEFLIQFKRT
jgi:serine/threonine protein kinase